MAANKRLYQTQKTREKIQATQIVNRLQEHFNGKVELSNTQVKAASILLAKVLPDLSASDVTHHEPEQSLAEKFQALVNQVGETQARAIYPDLADKYLGVKPTHDEPIVSQ